MEMSLDHVAFLRKLNKALQLPQKLSIRGVAAMPRHGKFYIFWGLGREGGG